MEFDLAKALDLGKTAGGTFSRGNLVDGVQASLSDRFILEVDGIDIAMISDVSRPGYKIETESFQILEYQVHFPKAIKFDNTITFSIIELLDPTVGMTQMENIMSRVIDDNFFTTPSAIGDPVNIKFGAGRDAKFNVSKKTLTGKNISIHILDADGNKYDSIKLVNPMITTVNPSGLKNSSGEINKITITVTFDYADYGRDGAYNYGGLIDKLKKYSPGSFAITNALVGSGVKTVNNK